MCYGKFLYVKIIDGTVNGIARAFGETGGAMRFLQTGLARSYAAIMLDWRNSFDFIFHFKIGVSC